jgi:acyl carrier protein
LLSVAPDLEGEAINSDEPFREQFEIDSMDFLNFVIALHKATGIEISERDYPQLETLAGCVRYLEAKGAHA